MKNKISKLIPTEHIEGRIFIIRGHKVILDSDLAELYGVPTRRLNEQMKRNRRRFPEDFTFRLTSREVAEWKSQLATFKEDANLRSQFATSKGRGGRRYLPYAFTEYGALMAANVLNSERAITMSIYIIRAFVRMREVFTVNQILEDRLTEIERVLINHDESLHDLFEKIRLLLLPPKKTDAVGFEVTSPRPGKIG